MLVYLNKSKTLFFLLFFFILRQSFAQSWSNWQTIYNANNLKVDISFMIYDCNQTQKQTKFRYQATGDLFAETKFLNWKMDYINCNNELISRQNSLNIGFDGDNGIIESMDDRFVCQSIQKYFYDVRTSNTPKSSNEIKMNILSKEPESIVGKTSIVKGESTTLEIKGGTLGLNAQWLWFKNDCSSKSIGAGNTIKVTPNETTTYFVKAVGSGNETNCTQTTVSVSQAWSDWQTIYNSNLLKVELAFNKYNCEITQKQSKFKYNITGSLFHAPKYLNWKMQYLDCDNNLVTQQNSLNIGKDGDDGIIESMDNVFSSKSLVKEYYDVDVSDVINKKIQKNILINTSPFQGSNNTITDIDGNTYNTITIGTQIWMIENLRTTRYTNGDYINKIVDNLEWKNDSIGAWCYYENDKSNDKIFGKLYNWYSVTNEKGVCPLGWHVPNNREWNRLIDELGGGAEAGSKMKLLSEWKSGLSSDNSSGFSGIPAGLRRKVGDFATIEEYAYYWSSTFIINKPNALCFILGYNDNNCYKDSTSKNDGLSCRCVKD